MANWVSFWRRSPTRTSSVAPWKEDRKKHGLAKHRKSPHAQHACVRNTSQLHTSRVELLEFIAGAGGLPFDGEKRVADVAIQALYESLLAQELIELVGAVYEGTRHVIFGEKETNEQRLKR